MESNDNSDFDNGDLMQDDDDEDEEEDDEANSEQKLLKSHSSSNNNNNKLTNHNNSDSNGVITVKAQVEVKAMHNGVGVNGFDELCMKIKMGW